MKISDVIFSVAMVGIITTGFVTALFGNKEINEYENRYAEKMDRFTVEGFMSGTFQNSVEPSLADRINFAESMKKAYNDINSAFIKKGVEKTVGKAVNHYIKIGDVYLFENNLVYKNTPYVWVEGLIDKRAEMYNSIFNNHRDIDFYLYYVEKDHDINFETGEKTGVFERLYDKLLFDKKNMARFSVDGFEDFKERFYKTDHHWNEEGSYIGYKEVLELLKKSDKPEKYGKKVNISKTFSGSKAVGEAAGYAEEFNAYEYDFEEMKISVYGNDAEDYGNYEKYIKGTDEAVNYAAFYGDDTGELIFETGKENEENLLIIGDSFDNAILKLLASHFNKTCSVDLRYYEPVMGEKFRFSEYVKKHEIDKVLFIGCIEYIITDDFVVEE